MISLLNEKPNIICLTEHHLTDYEMDALYIPKYMLGAGYGRKKFKKGGVCIFLQEDLHFTTINLQKYYKERDIEIVVIQLKLNGNKVIILSIYRDPAGDYDYFLNKLVVIQLKLNGNKVIILSIYRAPAGDYDYFLNKLDYILP
jgi:hypothetical protein